MINLIVKQLPGLLLHRGHNHDDGLNLRGWFIFYLLYLAGIAIIALVSLFELDHTASPLAQRVWLMGLYLFYMSLCCSFFPAPTAWIVLLMASPIIGLVQPVMLEGVLGSEAKAGANIATVAIVAAVGALGTSMANLNEYHIFTFLLRFGKDQRLRRSRFYQTAARWFEVSAFGLLVVFAFIPLPVDVIRWLAISHRYRRDRYGLAYFLGRFLRYSVLAGAAAGLQLEGREILAIQLALIGVVLLRYLPRLIKTIRQSRPAKATIETPSASETFAGPEEL